MRQTPVLVAAIGGIFAVLPVAHFGQAHHATTMFDHAKSMTIKGEISELRWVNPHVTLTVKGIAGDGDTAPANGKVEEWLMEMTSPGNLVRAGGWSRSAVKKGDEVIVQFSPLRDTSMTGGALKKVTLIKTGQSFTANIRMQEMPGLE